MHLRLSVEIDLLAFPTHLWFKPQAKLGGRRLNISGLNLSIHINLVAFEAHLQFKPPVQFVCKKLDNAIEMICILHISIDINYVAFCSSNLP